MTENQATLYPSDIITDDDALDIISPEMAPTLDQLFRERVRRSSDRVAYTEYDPKSSAWVDHTWDDIAAEVARWQVAFRDEGLEKGDRVSILLPNGCDWVIFDQAALRLGLAVVPLFVEDRPDNIAFVLQNSGTSLLLVDSIQDWARVRDSGRDISSIRRILCRAGDVEDSNGLERNTRDWLPETGQHLERGIAEPQDLASIVYTSGTTGRPKGVMLSHENIVSNAYSGLRSVPVYPEDVALSFLPLSHTFERTTGYYLQVMAGSRIAYNRSIPDLAEDLVIIRPSYIISVPRIFERVYTGIQDKLRAGPAVSRWLFSAAVNTGWLRFEYQQGRGSWSPAILFHPLLSALVARKVQAGFGGNLRLAILGGAALSPEVGRTFTSLGVILLQGYGLTESSPVISVNTTEHNRPDTIGLPLRGIEVAIGQDDELLARGSNVMMGYWGNEEATRKAIDEDGWLHTGDQAAIDGGYLRIIGRLKEILVLANGEKVPPVDMELAIASDGLFEQVLVVGEGRPYLTALVVLNSTAWEKYVTHKGLSIGEQDVNSAEVHALLLKRIARQVSTFPGYANIYRIHVSLDEWTVDSGLITATLKLKRPRIIERFKDEIEEMYEGH
jgi:long-chain acyl-CoA synthetase